MSLLPNLYNQFNDFIMFWLVSKEIKNNQIASSKYFQQPFYRRKLVRQEMTLPTAHRTQIQVTNFTCGIVIFYEFSDSFFTFKSMNLWTVNDKFHSCDCEACCFFHSETVLDLISWDEFRLKFIQKVLEFSLSNILSLTTYVRIKNWFFFNLTCLMTLLIPTIYSFFNYL